MRTNISRIIYIEDEIYRELEYIQDEINRLFTSGPITKKYLFSS